MRRKHGKRHKSTFILVTARGACVLRCWRYFPRPLSSSADYCMIPLLLLFFFPCLPILTTPQNHLGEPQENAASACRLS